MCITARATCCDVGFELAAGETVAVMGRNGMGKTTLIKTLLSTPGERLAVHDGTTTPTGGGA